MVQLTPVSGTKGILSKRLALEGETLPLFEMKHGGFVSDVYIRSNLTTFSRYEKECVKKMEKQEESDGGKLKLDSCAYERG